MLMHRAWDISELFTPLLEYRSETIKLLWWCLCPFWYVFLQSLLKHVRQSGTGPVVCVLLLCGWSALSLHASFPALPAGLFISCVLSVVHVYYIFTSLSKWRPFMSGIQRSCNAENCTSFVSNKAAFKIFVYPLCCDAKYVQKVSIRAPKCSCKNYVRDVTSQKLINVGNDNIVNFRETVSEIRTVPCEARLHVHHWATKYHTLQNRKRTESNKLCHL